jgi:hypothetical protein
MSFCHKIISPGVIFFHKNETSTHRRELNPLRTDFSAGLHTSIIKIVATIAYDRFAMFGFVTNNDSRQNIAEIAINIKLIIQLDFFF